MKLGVTMTAAGAAGLGIGIGVTTTAAGGVGRAGVGGVVVRRTRSRGDDLYLDGTDVTTAALLAGDATLVGGHTVARSGDAIRWLRGAPAPGR